MFHLKNLILMISLCLISQPLLAQKKDTVARPVGSKSQEKVGLSSPLENSQSTDDSNSIWSHEMKRAGKKRSSVLWFPLLSYVAPGAGQFMNGQTGAGFVYSGIAFAGLGTAASAIIELNNYEDREERLDEADSFDPIVRRYTWGMKTYDLAGSLSLYHSFHTVKKDRQKEGDFLFLPEDAETTDQLMLAPFEFGFMGRWSTILPLVAGLGLGIISGAHDNYETRRLNSGDILFSSAISYNAGVGEEALFRGWMFPLFVHAYGEENTFWANATQATIFGLAHLSGDNPFPVFQTFAGYYFGWLARKNGYSLREAIFVHTWWDVIVFTAGFTQGDKKASIYVPIYQTQF